MALDSSHGWGYGIGLSLGKGVEPVERCWVDHRWPRFAFQYDGLEITLQYFVHSQSIIQEYHIRNHGQEELKLPYIISSDICFREHGRQTRQFHPVPTGKSAERLLLFQNTEVLIRNDIEKCQLKMALFLNSKKQSLWTKSEPNRDSETGLVRESSDYLSVESEEANGEQDEANREQDEANREQDEANGEQDEANGEQDEANREQDEANREQDEADGELDEAERKLRSRILGGQLVDEDADFDLWWLYWKEYARVHAERQPASHDMANIATQKHNLVVPAGSTQKLCTVIQLSGLQLAESGPLEPQPESCEPAQKNDDDISPSNVETRARIRARQSTLRAKTGHINTENPNKEGILKIHRDHIAIGKAYAAIEKIADARYHLLMACLIAEYLYPEGSNTLSNTRLIYAKFLHSHGWHSQALEILENIVGTLSKGKLTTKDSKVLRKVQIRLANVYLETHRFAEAARLYQIALLSPIIGPTPDSARCLERIAWTQVKQEDYEEASKTYSLLSRRPEIRRQTVLINMGFIERKLGRFEEAKKIFVQALEANEAGHAIDQCYARSGLYACLCKLGITPEKHPKIGSSIVKCPDVVSLLLRSHSAQLSIPPQGFPSEFTLSRHIENLLSTCSVPVRDGNEPPGIAFVDADPIACYSEGRIA